LAADLQTAKSPALMDWNARLSLFFSGRKKPLPSDFRFEYFLLFQFCKTIYKVKPVAR
jgi:hypothetical protein